MPFESCVVAFGRQQLADGARSVPPGYVRRSEDRLCEPRSRPRAWAGTARHPMGTDVAERTGDTGPRSRALRREFISAIGWVSRGFTGRTGDHPGMKDAYPSGPANCLALTRSTGSCRGPDIAGWRGCPTPAVSPRSTGSRRGAAIPGWRGCPTPAVSPRLAGYLRAADIPGWGEAIAPDSLVYVELSPYGPGWHYLGTNGRPGVAAGWKGRCGAMLRP